MRLEDEFWRIRTDTGELADAEHDALRAYLDEKGFKTAMIDDNRWRGHGLTSPDISQALMSSTTVGSGASSERAKHHGLRRLGRVLVDPLSHPIERREIPPRESLTMSPWSN